MFRHRRSLSQLPRPVAWTAPDPVDRLDPCITFVTLGELVQWTIIRSWGPRRRASLDTWIAACCLVERLPLATLNTKDFADFSEHDGLELLDTR